MSKIDDLEILMAEHKEVKQLIADKDTAAMVNHAFRTTSTLFEPELNALKTKISTAIAEYKGDIIELGKAKMQEIINGV